MSRQERFISSLSFQFLTNTLELDLSNIYGKGQFPNRRDIHSFISEEMKVTAVMLRGVQHHPRFPKVFVQFERENDLLEVEARVKDGLVMQSKGIKIFGYRCDKPMVTIVLNGQDMALEVDEIKRVMERYGKVVTCERGKNSDLSTREKFITDGTWIIRLSPRSMTKPPPETIYYFGVSGDVQTWILNYDGVGSSCVLCGLAGHMGFRCRSTNPKDGLGRAPAGFGRWTDVQCYQAPVAVDGAPPPPQPGTSSEVTAADNSDRNATFRNAMNAGAGLSSSQPVSNTAGGQIQKQLSASQGSNTKLAKALDLDSFVNKKGWGNDLTVGRLAVSAPKMVRNNPSIPGLSEGVKNKPIIPDVDESEDGWETVGKNGGKGRKNRGKKQVSDTESEDEQPKIQKPKGRKVFAVNRIGSATTSYGSRRSVSLMEFLKQGQIKDSKKRNRNTVETSMKKKKKKNSVGSKEEEQEINLDDTQQEDEVVVPEQEAAADPAPASLDDSIENGSENLPAAQSDEDVIENLENEAENHANMEVVGVEQAVELVNPVEVDPGQLESTKPSSQDGAGGTSSLTCHPLDTEREEIAVKAAKMKAALEAQKN